MQKLKNNDLSELKDKSIFEKLLKNEYIVPELKHIYEIDKYNPAALTLTLAPTMCCNLCCSYCFEQNNKTSKLELMDEETQNNIANYIERQSGKIKNINVVWFGGEPLLAVSVIARLTKIIKKITDENKIKYNSSMVTNGTLIYQNPNMIQTIKDNFITAYKLHLMEIPRITIKGEKQLVLKRELLILSSKLYKY